MSDIKYITDSDRIDFLQIGGRVEARTFQNMDDDFEWSISDGVSLRQAIDAALCKENRSNAELSLNRRPLDSRMEK